MHHPPEGEALWDALMAGGREMELQPFGVEAQRVLRLEKGHVIIGQDTDGLTTPEEAGMGWAVSKRKPFFVGSRAIRIRARQGLSKQLVGFTLCEPGGTLPEECCLVIDENGDIEGRVTSVTASPALGTVIGLAFVSRPEIDRRFRIRTVDGRMTEARIVETPFYDPDNSRQEL